MKVRLALLLLGAPILMGYSFTGQLCSGQSSQAAPQSTSSEAALPPQPTPTNAQVDHIEINSPSNCQRGCPQDLSVKSVVILQNGREYPVRVLRPLKTESAPGSHFATHLLVVFQPGTHRPKDSELAMQLNRVLSQGWLVSVSRADGSFTPYATNRATLEAALAAIATAPLTADQEDLAVQAAVEALDKFPGHRLVLLDVGGAKHEPSALWNNLEKKTHAQFYVVDGGGQGLAYSDESWGDATEGAPRGGDLLLKKTRVYDGTVFHEIQLASALKNALKDVRNDYDLIFAIPASSSDPPGPITLKLQDDEKLNPNGLNIELYTLTRQTVNGKSYYTRSTAPLNLINAGP